MCARARALSTHNVETPPRLRRAAGGEATSKTALVRRPRPRPRAPSSRENARARFVSRATIPRAIVHPGTEPEGKIFACVFPSPSAVPAKGLCVQEAGEDGGPFRGPNCHRSTPTLRHVAGYILVSRRTVVSFAGRWYGLIAHGRVRLENYSTLLVERIFSAPLIDVDSRREERLLDGCETVPGPKRIVCRDSSVLVDRRSSERREYR